MLFRYFSVILMTFKLDANRCAYCAGCVSVCPVLALTLMETRLECDEKLCTKCRICEKACPVRAITIID